MGFVGKPGPARALRAAINATQNALGARNFPAHGNGGYTALPYTEERAQIPIACAVKYNTLTVLMVIDAFAWLELNLCFHVLASRNPQMKQASGLAAVAEQDFLRILVCLAPEDAPEVDLILSMWRGT